jgi:hypothetical protein
MVAAVSSDAALAQLSAAGVRAWVAGSIKACGTEAQAAARLVGAYR